MPNMPEELYEPQKTVAGLSEEQWKERYITYLRKHSDILDWQGDEFADAAWNTATDETPEECAATELSYLDE
jgi:hypothetical protein